MIVFLSAGVLSGLVVEWGFLNIKVVFFFNRLSFSLILLVVTISVLVFASYYMRGDSGLVYFLLVLIIFVVRMFFLNLSGRVFSILVS